MTETFTPAQFVARMVVEFSLPAVRGVVEGAAPIEAIPLSADQRAKFGFKHDGTAFLFQLSQGVGVFLDLSGNRTQFWFDNASARGAQDLVEAALLAKHPNFRRLADEKRAEPKTRRRVFEGDVSADRVAQVEISYPESGGSGSALFVVQVFGLHRDGDRILAAPLPPMMPPNILGRS